MSWIQGAANYWQIPVMELQKVLEPVLTPHPLFWRMILTSGSQLSPFACL